MKDYHCLHIPIKVLTLWLQNETLAEMYKWWSVTETVSRVWVGSTLGLLTGEAQHNNQHSVPWAALKKWDLLCEIQNPPHTSSETLGNLPGYSEPVFFFFFLWNGINGTCPMWLSTWGANQMCAVSGLLQRPGSGSCCVPCVWYQGSLLLIAGGNTRWAWKEPS